VDTHTVNDNELFRFIQNDTENTRFTSRIIFVDNLDKYNSIVNGLCSKADMVVHLSDTDICRGADTIPDFCVVREKLDNLKDKFVVVPGIGEYLRLGERVEKSTADLYSIINRHVHSTGRVWFPVFSAKNLFVDIVGELNPERFTDYIFEYDCEPTNFEVTVFSKAFENENNTFDAHGIRAWLSMWDSQCVKSAMSFTTKNAKSIRPQNGRYSLSVVNDPFDYIKNSVGTTNSRLKKELGTDEQWASLAKFVPLSNNRLDTLINSALNQISFDPYSVLRNWNTANKWLFSLWYKLGLNLESDYISLSVLGAKNIDDLVESIECTILSCYDSPYFDEWLLQRERALRSLGHTKLSDAFWSSLESIEDYNVKLKVLTCSTSKEKAEIIDIVKNLIKNGMAVSDCRKLIKGKYQDLYTYLDLPKNIKPNLADYILKYKINKISDSFSFEASKAAGDFDVYDFQTRGQLLYALKNENNCHFIWIDGMGIEWIDLLLEKIKSQCSDLRVKEIEVGTAALPTITTVNMKKADPETISEKKYDALDALSHIKNKQECNYQIIISKQFDMLNDIAALIISAAQKNPNKDIVVTADHGMTRLGALGFHQTEGIKAPAYSNVCNHGRYCELPDNSNASTPINTKREGNVLAYRTYNHFIISGNAPGEVHGGASPEEVLVPIIRFTKLGNGVVTKKDKIKYRLVSNEVVNNNLQAVTIQVITASPADSLTVEIKANRIMAESNDGINWTATVYGLEPGMNYELQVFPNDIYNDIKKTLFVKKRGLDIDDDF